MKHIPNMLTISRMIFVISMLFFYKNPWIFAVLYTAAVLSDVLDGLIARRTHAQTPFGARLDSFADLLMYGIIVMLIFYWVGDLLAPGIPLIAIIAGVRIISILIAAAKFHTFVSLHTWGNKLTGILIFLAPIVFIISKSISFFWFVGLIALLSAIEEGLIHLMSDSVNENRRSIFLSD
ncbi:CDP-alcohol phosphatidyltransferase family protein [Sporolactobacillus pectinivorans]|uniref:CDP-alcohol phosphatidyltransferase family protein n=1 Tax=Sporolactobacillus pectinivorans TaxID=1591408 RepID=UPI000C2564FC|nr:CDP-alcohol phosphatidyltransferase family protein [Sporolactobacillus pectinivorans]